jgi:hypothetical protein
MAEEQSQLKNINQTPYYVKLGQISFIHNQWKTWRDRCVVIMLTTFHVGIITEVTEISFEYPNNPGVALD